VVWTGRGNLGDQTADAVTVRETGKPDRKLTLPKLAQHGRRGSLDAFAKAIAAGEEPENSARRNVLSLATSYGAVESARTHDTVDLR